MEGTVTWWNKERRWGRIKGPDATYMFSRKYVAPTAKDHTFRRGERVSFVGDQTARGRVACKVAPIG